MKRRIMALLLAATLVFQGVSTVPVFANEVESGTEITAEAEEAVVFVEKDATAELTVVTNAEEPTYAWYSYVQYNPMWGQWSDTPIENATAATLEVTGDAELASKYKCVITYGDAQTLEVEFTTTLIEATLTVNTGKEIESAGGTQYFKFIPATSGRYSFYSLESMDGPSATLFDADMNYLTEAWSEETNNFSFSYMLEAEKTYYLGVTFNWGGAATIYADDNSFYATADQTEVEVYVDQTTDLEVNAGDVAGAVTYQWYVSEDGFTFDEIENATEAKYTLNGAEPESVKTAYRCDVTSYDGTRTKSVTFNTTLTSDLKASVDGKSFFRAEVGTPVTLAVKAEDGKGDITYRWEYYDKEAWEWLAVEGATSSATCTFNMPEGNNDMYRCVVADDYKEIDVSFTVKEAVPNLVYGDTVKLNDQTATYQFIPDADGTYTFYAEGVDTSITLKDAEDEVFAESECDTETHYTEVSDSLKKGETYYVEFNIWWTEDYETGAILNVTASDINIADCVVDVKNSVVTYNAAEQKATVSVKLGNYTLVEGKDYTLSYANNKNVGTAKVTVTGKGNFKGSVTKDFATIKAATITANNVTVNPTNFTYNGSAQNAGVVVKVGNVTLKENVDYTVVITNNVNKGTATVVVTGKGNYTGKVTTSYVIDAASIANATVSVATVKYTGKALKPAVTVKVGNVTLKEGVDYTVSYSNNKNIGNGKVTIAGIGNYAGSKEVTFKIAAKKGDKFTVGSYKYKVTGTSTVAFAGIKSTKTTTVKVADTVKIGGKTFKVTSIADKALYKKTKVKTVKIGKNVTTIGKSAFEGCTKLSAVTIGAKVTKIGDKAFKKCTALKKITIPAKVTTIGKEAFSGAKNLKTITVKATNIKTVGKNAFKSINKKATIKVPSKKVSAYKKTFKNGGQAKTVKIKK